MVGFSKSAENAVKKTLISPEDFDKTDFKAEWDSSLGKAENISSLKAKFPHLFKAEINADRLESEASQLLSLEAEDAKKEMEKAVSRIRKGFAESEFFSMPKDILSVVKKAEYANCFVLKSKAGLGKSCFLLSHMKDAVVLNGRCTAIELYNFLYKNNGKTVVLEDVEELLKDSQAKNILLAVTWNPSGRRLVGWNSNTKYLEAPKTFSFTGKLIITINDMPKDLDAFLSRAVFYEVKLTYAETLEMMYSIADKRKIPVEICDFIKEVSTEASELNFRLLDLGWDFYRHGSDWKALLKSQIKVEPTKDYFLKLRLSGKAKKEQIRDFMEETGLSRRMFFKYQKEFHIEDKWTEKNIIKNIINNPEIIEKGMEYVSSEYGTERMRIDLLMNDSSKNPVIVEVKACESRLFERTKEEGMEQLRKYYNNFSILHPRKNLRALLIVWSDGSYYIYELTGYHKTDSVQTARTDA